MNNYSVGRDIAIDLFNALTNSVLRLNLQTGFTAKQLTTEIKIKGLDGLTRFQYLPDGWQGEIELTRGGPEVEDYILAQEAAYFAGQNVPASQITETIVEPDGMITQYRYVGVMTRLPDAGSWAGDKEIKMKLEWCASRKFKI